MQIKTVYDHICTLKDTDGNPVSLRIDSHVHTHSIPLVFDSLIEALKNLDLLDKTQYIRNPREPFLMFFTTKGVISRVPFINIIKNIILNVLGISVGKKLNRLGISSGIMWGLMMSGNMDVDRVNALLPKMNSLALKKDLHLEVLCHPGIVLEEEKRPEYGKDDLIAFFSKNRDVEYDMLMEHISV
ncbi:MAG: ChbG/HpnK family deacetylase [Lachnospiraceae bacterium]|nr:ChbG/HpnK family deacetylase [Lachnospiraceae bacterium]